MKRANILTSGNTVRPLSLAVLMALSTSVSAEDLTVQQQITQLQQQIQKAQVLLKQLSAKKTSAPDPTTEHIEIWWL
ncbi:hypothetical protein [Vibrio nitrifigilis]|uniref:Uncharacterized protein n=1 Tax=Vibrio nitrifigilis TaxID=2789781 RepID=A0ABS0GFP8_9VIBR|nr:hypothetical protein [Vibrio nitrifigilis]MBF9001234.1 hypothetical protein [Vibrio nitrifigilis]